MSASNIRHTATSYAFRRGILPAIGFAGFCALSAPAFCAQPADFPNKPIRIVAGFSTGSTVDLSARVVAEKLTEIATARAAANESSIDAAQMRLEARQQRNAILKLRAEIGAMSELLKPMVGLGSGEEMQLTGGLPEARAASRVKASDARPDIQGALQKVKAAGQSVDLAKARARLESLQGREYWRSLEELLDTEDFREHLHREFRVPIDSGVDRRQLSLRQEATHVSVRRRVDVDGEGRERLVECREPLVLVEGVVRLGSGRLPKDGGDFVACGRRRRAELAARRQRGTLQRVA